MKEKITHPLCDGTGIYKPKGEVKYVAFTASFLWRLIDRDWATKHGILYGKNTTEAWLMRKKLPYLDFLDWDVWEATKNAEKTRDRHMWIVKEFRPSIVMGPDIFYDDNDRTIKKKLEYVDKLMCCASRVVVPVHRWHKRLEDYEIAFPGGVYGPKNNFFIWELQDHVTHILGGTPKKQKYFKMFFPRCISVDGNSILRQAMKFGKILTEDGNWEQKDWGLNEIFKKSVENLIKFWGL